MPSSNVIVGLDFETYSSVSLPDYGLDRYISDKHFRPLIASIYNPDGRTETIDFVQNLDRGIIRLTDLFMQRPLVIAAHNAGFERAVLKWCHVDLPATRFLDTAVIARAAGAASKLEAAAPQLLDWDKMDEGRSLIKLFSIPGKLQEENGFAAFDERIVQQHAAEWLQFKEYCERDATLGWLIADRWKHVLTGVELDYQAVTMNMNTTGWRVDLDLVHEMQRRYEQNKVDALKKFRVNCNAPNLNLNSFPQLKAWCKERGVLAKSFDETHVASMLKKLRAKIASGSLTISQLITYEQVIMLLETKQVLGGSSLKKLQTIIDYTGEDGRLRDQYLHAGAGQTLRTTGRSVQMQNLKRLATPADMDELADPNANWSNTQLAQNLRQVFTASHPQGRLIVGDFSSVESRGLAWLAGESWKTDAYRQGQDLYKVLATQMFNAQYDDVSKEQRQVGKVGELSCGYGAGPGAVREFAKNMGVDLTEGEATSLVYDWRNANPRTVEFWKRLDDMLHEVIVSGRPAIRYLPGNLVLRIRVVAAPQSLHKMHPTAVSIAVEVSWFSQTILRRFFHGCHLRGKDICYYRPSDRKTGDLWSNSFVNQKTKQRQNYKIYGGKLAGILTQSFCRELFFHVLAEVDEWFKDEPNVKLVGQFHDEIVLDWTPTSLIIGLSRAMNALGELMESVPDWADSFPLAADVKCDYRYTK